MTTTNRMTWLAPMAALLALVAACGPGTDSSGRTPVEPVEVVSVQIEPSEVTLDVGETLELAVLVVTVEHGLSAQPEVTFESKNGSVVSVSGQGTIEGLAPGQAIVVASAGGVEGRTVVTVREPVVEPPPPLPVETVEPSEARVTLIVGAKRQLSAVAKDANGDEVQGATVTWASLDERVATVTEGGLLTATGVGLTAVTATAGGKTGEVTVLVAYLEPPPVVVDRVVLDAMAFVLQPGASRTLTATALTAQGAVVPGATITWTSLDHRVATVALDGRVTAVGAGQTGIVATSSGKSATATVTVPEVTPPPTGVARVELSETALTLAEGTTHVLTATPRNAQGDAVAGLAVLWRTSDEGVAYVSAGGEVRAYRAGVVDITATVHGKVAAARVTVTLDTPYDLFFEAFSADEQRHVFYTRDLRDPAAASARLMGGPTGPSHPVPSPDGTRLAVVLSTPGATRGEVRVVDLDRNALASIMFDGHVDDPAWSPDGERLAVRVHSPGTGTDVWTMRADGSERVNLTADQGASNESSPTWSPVALGRLAYARWAGGTSTIWTMAVDGSDKQQLTSGVADAEPAWSPDGGVIAFQRSASAIFGDIYLVAPDGSGLKSLGQLPLIQSSPAWSPDGALLAFTSGPEVWTARRDGGFLARRTFDGELLVETRPGWLKVR